MSLLEQLKERLRQSRADMLAAVRDLPEAVLQERAAVDEWSVAELIAQRIEAENRALTLIQSMLHGHPRLPMLSRAELDRRAVLRRRDWEWDHLLRELYQQREETSCNLEDLKGERLTRPVMVGEEVLTPYQVLSELAEEEERLATALWVWRQGRAGETRKGDAVAPGRPEEDG